MIRLRASLIVLVGTFFVARSASGQSFTPDPGSWRPVAYTDLMFPVGEAEAYASIWQDRLDDSNRRLASKAQDPGQSGMSLAMGNLGAREWHFAINFQSKLVVLSVLATPVVCTDEYRSPSEAARILVCDDRGRALHDPGWSRVLPRQRGKRGRARTRPRRRRSPPMTSEADRSSCTRS